MSTCQGCGAALPPSRGHRPRKWCSESCRKHTLYGGTCANCGKPTYSGTLPPPELCLPCHARTTVIWTPEAVVEAIREFARRYGRQPAATDFNPAHARLLGFSDRAERFYTDGCYPALYTVILAFGSWNAGIAAAGFTPIGVGRYERRRAA